MEHKVQRNAREQKRQINAESLCQASIKNLSTAVKELKNCYLTYVIDTYDFNELKLQIDALVGTLNEKCIQATGALQMEHKRQVDRLQAQMSAQQPVQATIGAAPPVLPSSRRKRPTRKGRGSDDEDQDNDEDED